jgi:hypothetical protein
MTRTFLVAIAVLAAGCRSEDKRESPTETRLPRVTSLTFHHGSQGQPGEKVQRFDFRQRELFFVAEVDPPLKNATVRWLFQTIDSTGGNNRPVARVEEKASGSRVTAKISLATDWPVGNYEGVIVIDDDPVKTFEYEIGGQRTRIDFRSHAVAPDDGRGEPQKRDVPVTSKDKVIHIAVFTVGIDTEGRRVVWTLRKKGQAKDLAMVDLGLVKLQNSVVSVQFRSESGWEAGEYTAIVSLDGKPAHSIDFPIK